ncbi:MAG: hypothetical protein OSA99_12510 [Acidimicrobiales bacterium]|nr:hypothetical protein [Acidimicrobiales bacterium]
MSWLGAAMVTVTLMASCSASPPDSAAELEDSPGSTSTESSTTTSVTTTTTSAPAPPFELQSDEVEPELKLTAARLVESLLSYRPSADPLGEASLRIEAAGFDPSLVPSAAPLLVADSASDVTVVYPQFGGLEPNDAAIMVVAEQRIRPKGCCAGTTTRTLDIRLSRKGAGWDVTGIDSVGGQRPVDTSTENSDLAQQVLATSALVLPDSARWDVEAGLIADEVLRLLLDLVAAGHSLEVTSFVSGHPVNVFGRPFVSNHSLGRAVDIWAVDGARVSGSTPDGGAHRAVERALALGATEVGSPWDLDGPGGPSFTNTLHADHLHLAFDP